MFLLRFKSRVKDSLLNCPHETDYKMTLRVLSRRKTWITIGSQNVDYLSTYGHRLLIVEGLAFYDPDQTWVGIQNSDLCSYSKSKSGSQSSPWKGKYVPRIHNAGTYREQLPTYGPIRIILSLELQTQRTTYLYMFIGSSYSPALDYKFYAGKHIVMVFQ